MPITVACPHCDAKLKLPDSVSGKTLKCPKCTDPFIAPEIDAPSPATPVRPKVIDAEPVDPPPRRRPRVVDEEEERPRRRSRSRAVDAVEDDEPPRRRSKSRVRVAEDSDDFDDEDDRPRRRRKNGADKRKPSPVLLIGIGVGALVLIGLLGGGAYFLLGSGEEKSPQEEFVSSRTAPQGWSEVGNKELAMRVFLPGNVKGDFSEHAKPKDYKLGDKVETYFDKNQYTAQERGAGRSEGLTAKLIGSRSPGFRPGSSQAELLAEFEKHRLFWGINNEVVKSVPITCGGKQGLRIYVEEKPHLMQPNSGAPAGFFAEHDARETARINKKGLHGVAYVFANGEWSYVVGLSQSNGQPIPEDVQKTVEESFEFD